MNQEISKLALDWEDVVDAMAEGVVLFDVNGIIRLCNVAMTELTGRSKQDLVGRDISTLHPEACFNRKRILAMLAREDEREMHCDHRQCFLVNQTGEKIPGLFSARPVRNRSGELVAVLQTITDLRYADRLQETLEQLRTGHEDEAKFHRLIGQNPGMRELYRLLELAADSDATVLLQGESGTGKELAAEAIHLQGHRRNKPFVKVNCGALPETILESELFGHVKGAYTGAYRDRPGRFEAADGGTIFLDEIGEISQSVQVKLLRVLQHFEFERVGDDETRKVDVRVIAATNRDLAQRVMENEFREDFYYRLRVFPIKMPPLRERLDDLPLLIDHFINRFNEKTGKHITGLDEQALRAVSDYCWPGNIRELENAIEHAFVTCQTTLITLFDLPQELRRFELRREICDRNPNVQEQQTEQARMDIPKPARRQDNKRRDILHSAEALREVLDNCDWNKAETARTLGVSRTAVWQWMKRHGIPMNG